MTRTPWWMRTLVLAVPAVLLAAAAIGTWWHATDAERNWLHANAVALRIAQPFPGKSDAVLHVLFTDASGAEITAKTTLFDQAERGLTIEILYDPNDPTDVRAADFGVHYWAVWVLTALSVLAALGAVMAALGLAFHTFFE